MNLGLEGRKAIVCASSQGLGLACATALAREGAEVLLNGRDAGKLERAQTSILAASPTAVVRFVAADITTEDGRAALIDAVPEPDILINNNAGPPPGQIEDWDREAWLGATESNMIAPLLLIRSVLPGMRARRFGRIVNITSAMVKSPRYAMSLSTAARAGLTAACKAISREVAADNVTINNLLPERIDTPRQAFMAERMMKAQSITREVAREQIVASIAAKRFGTPEEFGDACAFLCAVQAGFISGQNLQLDGGSYSGLV
jgi:3-oxoacyl-[acyl-carrier protein] reductase